MAKNWNTTIPWEKDSSYILRCTEANFGLSGAGNPMITFKFEVAAPEVMKDSKGEEWTIAGTKITTWQVCQTMVEGTVDAEKTARNHEDLKKWYRAFGMDDTNINPENPDVSGFVGKAVYALLYNTQNEQRKSPTKEQLAEGKKQGDVLMNPVTKQPLMSNYPKIGEVFGLATNPDGTPF